MRFTNDLLVHAHQVLYPLVAAMAESLVPQLKLFLGLSQVVIQIQNQIVGIYECLSHILVKIGR